MTAMAVGLAGLVFLAGCPPKGSAVPRTCSHLGQQCDLGGGVLGVCNATSTGTCDGGLCLVCAPQH